ncbi:hypothetical protein [Aureibacillus halotolerans]|uniref:Glycosyl transferase family 1 n=1 Tax=Aureibacillus halotolerans TaxID=1508390 RepID=A0A4R6UCZ1_9BACI|nr:hypothetical protein [Aureibacillus halotolerans]TDQ43003.1 glycosyl transferase family 1 [Aureibacillus halotolerans]
MKHIVYYVSDQGGVHARRSVVLINALLEADLQLCVTIVVSESDRYIRRRLYMFKERIVFRTIPMTIGYVTADNGFDYDLWKMKERLAEYQEVWPALWQTEAAYLKECRPALVISDIDPVALQAASIAKVPSIGISHHTWFSTFRDMGFEQLDFMQNAYESMTHWIGLAGNNEKDWGRESSQQIVWFGKCINDKRVRRLRKRWLSKTDKKQIVFIGLGDEVGHVKLPTQWAKMENAVFVVSSGRLTGDANVVPVPKFERFPEDYIAASDWMICEPRWNLVADAVLAGVPSRLIGREQVAEDRQLCQLIEAEHLGKGHLITSWNQFAEEPFTAPPRRISECDNQLPELLHWIQERLHLSQMQPHS